MNEETMLQSKLDSITKIVARLDLLESRFNEFLEGFVLYDEYKGTLDIELYERSLELFKSAIAAMHEQMKDYHTLTNQLKNILESN